jgi:hypothetical protein
MILLNIVILARACCEIRRPARARAPARARSVGFQRRKANPISPGNDLFHCSDGDRKNLHRRYAKALRARRVAALLG